MSVSPLSNIHSSGDKIQWLFPLPFSHFFLILHCLMVPTGKEKDTFKENRNIYEPYESADLNFSLHTSCQETLSHLLRIFIKVRLQLLNSGQWCQPKSHGLERCAGAFWWTWKMNTFLSKWNVKLLVLPSANLKKSHLVMIGNAPQLKTRFPDFRLKT